MKKTLSIAFVVLLFISAVSCSKDDDNRIDEIPYEPQSNEIKMIFNATTENNEALFYISGDNFTINWGDGKTSRATDVGNDLSISHKYRANREYVITITTRRTLEYFKNFSANNLWDFDEEKIPVFESINIGNDVDIDVLYIQASGVKKFISPNEKSFKEAYLLLGSGDWDLSKLRADKLSMYITRRDDLEIKNLNTKNLRITVKESINNLSVSSCDNLLYLDISAILQRKATIKNLTVANMARLEDVRFYALTGRTTTLSGLSALKFFMISGFDYETMDMSNDNSPSTNLTFKAQAISVHNSTKLDNRFVEVEINNTQSGLTSDITALDFSMCSKLTTVSIAGLKSLENIKFGDKNNVLDEVVLKSLPKLKGLDLSSFENLKRLEIRYSNLFETAKFGSKNKLLESVRFEDTNFSVASCIEMINSLPDFYIPNIPTVNRRRLTVVNDKFSLSNNTEITAAYQKIRPYWVCHIE